MWLTYICAPPPHIHTEVGLGTDPGSHPHYCNQHLCMHQAPRVQVLLHAYILIYSAPMLCSLAKCV